MLHRSRWIDTPLFQTGGIMERRSFLKKAGVGLAASAVAAPAIGQGAQPEVKWRLAASWPKSLDTLYGGAEHISQRFASPTNRKFQIPGLSTRRIGPPLPGVGPGAES